MSAEFFPLATLALRPQWALTPALPTGTRFIRLSGQATGDSYAIAFFSAEVSGLLSPQRAIDLEDPLIVPVPDIPTLIRVGVRQRRRYKRVPIRTRTVSIRVDVLLTEEPI